MSECRRLCGLIGLSLVLFTGGARASEPTTRIVDVDIQTLDSYVGRYQLKPPNVMTLTRFRNQLHAQVSGKPIFPVYAETATKFFYMFDLLRITMRKNPAGEVTGLLFEGPTFKREAPKISKEPVEADRFEEVHDCPRIAALAKELAGGSNDAVEVFWKKVQDKAPLIEPFPGDPHSSWVTFLYRGDSETGTVLLDGGPDAGFRDGTRTTTLSRLADTDVWYRTARVPNDARFAYTFGVNLPRRMPDDPKALSKIHSSCMKGDPLNPKWIDANGEAPMAVWSVLELPEAPPQPYFRAAGTPAGELTNHTIDSRILRERRMFRVYTPPGFDPKAATANVLFLFDGHIYGKAGMIAAPTNLDNLLAAGKIEPTVMVLVDQENRLKELNRSDTFAAFMAKELVPWTREHYHVGSDPKRTVIGGVSLGGLMASYCALKHSDVFGNVLSQSGSYQVYPGAFDKPPAQSLHGGALAGEFLKAPKLPVRFYLEAGQYENPGMNYLLAENRRLRDVLLAKGYDLTYSEFSGGHHFINWRGSFADAMIALFPKGRK
jgi:enterochelin esterase family protein